MAVCSNGEKYKKASIRKELKRLKRLQRKASRIYLYMRNNNISYREKSKRFIKLEKQILKMHHRINNLLNNNIHQITAKIIKANPSHVVIEDLNIKGMFKNRHLSGKLKYAKLGEVIRQIKYKCAFNNIQLIVADRWYASSKICSCCGHKKERLFLSERVFVCEKCKISIDRDYNATLNLKALAM